MNFRKFFPWLGAILLGFLWFQHGSAAPRELKVGYLPILDHLPLMVSHATDAKEFEHIQVTPKMFTSWREMVGALDAGVINAAFILSPLAMDLFNRGMDIRAVLLAHRDGSAITVKKGSPIQGAADLRGKTIAIPAAKATHTALLNHYLQGAGLSLNDVTTKVIAPPHMPLAMKHNRIDAFIVAEPFGAQTQHRGLGKILVLTKDIHPNHVECIVVVKQTELIANPQGIGEWIGSLVRAGRLIDRDKRHNGSRQVAKLTAKRYFPHAEETVIMGLLNPADRISFSDLNPALADMREIEQMAIRAGILQPVALERFIDNRFFLATSHNSPTEE